MSFQECYLKFGSWVYSKEQLNLIVEENAVDLSNYQNNEEWTIEKNRMVYPISRSWKNGCTIFIEK